MAINNLLIIGFVVGLIAGIFVFSYFVNTNNKIPSATSATISCLRTHYDQMRGIFISHESDWVFYGQNAQYNSAYSATTAMSAAIKRDAEQFPTYSTTACP